MLNSIFHSIYEEYLRLTYKHKYVHIFKYTDMITKTETKTLSGFLALTSEPDDTFTLDELLGYLFGLAMTPEPITPSEWQPVIFGGEMVDFVSSEQAETMLGCLMQVLNRLTAEFHGNILEFPYVINELNERELEQLYDWVSGFEEALALREEIWDPEDNAQLQKRAKEELYHSLMTIQGLVDPMEVMDFFEKLPDEIFKETFPDMDTQLTDREEQVQMFLLSSLPLAVTTLKKHAYAMQKKQSGPKVVAAQKKSTSSSAKIIKVDFQKSNK